MKSLHLYYTYIFYFFYNSVNKVKGNISVEWKAVFLLLSLELGFLISLVTYYLDIFKTIAPSFGKLQLLIVVLPLVILKLYIFERNENWRTIVAEFNKWPQERRKKYDRITKIIIAFVVINILASFYIMSEIDWKQYR